MNVRNQQTSLFDNAFSNAHINVAFENLEVCYVFNNGPNVLGVVCKFQPIALIYAVEIEGVGLTREVKIGNSKVLVIEGVELGQKVNVQYFY